MSMQFRRSGVIPVSFAVFMITTILVPGVNVVFSLFLLVLGLAVSTMVYVLWQDPPLALALAHSTAAERRHPTGKR